MPNPGSGKQSEAHIAGGIGEGYEMNYDSRDIRHHVDHKRY